MMKGEMSLHKLNSICNIKINLNEQALKVCKKKYDKGFVFLIYKELLQTDLRWQTVQWGI